jgi:hypothetical protein
MTTTLNFKKDQERRRERERGERGSEFDKSPFHSQLGYVRSECINLFHILTVFLIYLQVEFLQVESKIRKWTDRIRQIGLDRSSRSDQTVWIIHMDQKDWMD